MSSSAQCKAAVIFSSANDMPSIRHMAKRSWPGLPRVFSPSSRRSRSTSSAMASIPEEAMFSIVAAATVKFLAGKRTASAWPSPMPSGVISPEVEQPTTSRPGACFSIAALSWCASKVCMEKNRYAKPAPQRLASSAIFSANASAPASEEVSTVIPQAYSAREYTGSLALLGVYPPGILHSRFAASSPANSFFAILMSASVRSKVQYTAKWAGSMLPVNLGEAPRGAHDGRPDRGQKISRQRSGE